MATALCCSSRFSPSHVFPLSCGRLVPAHGRIQDPRAARSDSSILLLHSHSHCKLAGFCLGSRPPPHPPVTLCFRRNPRLRCCLGCIEMCPDLPLRIAGAMCVQPPWPRQHHRSATTMSLPRPPSSNPSTTTTALSPIPLHCLLPRPVTPQTQPRRLTAPLSHPNSIIKNPNPKFIPLWPEPPSRAANLWPEALPPSPANPQLLLLPPPAASANPGENPNLPPRRAAFATSLWPPERRSASLPYSLPLALALSLEEKEAEGSQTPLSLFRVKTAAS